MKKIYVLFIAITLLFSSCALHSGLTTNLNNNTTEVVLAKNNYKVIKRVKGESQAMYVFGIGGHSRKGLIAEAKTKMLSKADVVGRPRAIINETVEIKRSFFPIVRTYKVIVSGYLIEFTE